ncbi:PREDICTED: basic proline-rich protein-like, partial [Chinchilla lanigera]|uniref:basic proline-rich protein-like n=1 Tax=Chinchilla lanigera TaxID=34839 RepID=UPI000696F4DB
APRQKPSPARSDPAPAGVRSARGRQNTGALSGQARRRLHFPGASSPSPPDRRSQHAVLRCKAPRHPKPVAGVGLTSPPPRRPRPCRGPRARGPRCRSPEAEARALPGPLQPGPRPAASVVAARDGPAEDRARSSDGAAARHSRTSASGQREDGPGERDAFPRPAQRPAPPQPQGPGPQTRPTRGPQPRPARLARECPTTALRRQTRGAMPATERRGRQTTGHAASTEQPASRAWPEDYQDKATPTPSPPWGAVPTAHREPCSGRTSEESKSFQCTILFFVFAFNQVVYQALGNCKAGLGRTVSPCIQGDCPRTLKDSGVGRLLWKVPQDFVQPARILLCT